ncbi:MAG: hypothetical protein ACYC3I_25045 [Gemmataceae bacterium]
MPPSSTASWIALLAFWALMLPVAGYIFQTVCNMVGAESPTFRRSILITVLATAVAFFLFDGIGYAVVSASRNDLKLNLPPGYNYTTWLREPLPLKWQVMGLIPLLRPLLILFGVCLATTLYVFALSEAFRICLAILLIQWTMNVVAMTILSFALSNIMRVVAPMLPESSSAETEQAQNLSPPGAEGKQIKHPKQPRPEKNAPTKTEKKPEAESGAEAATSDLQGALASREGSGESAVKRLEEDLDSYLEPLKEAAAPYTKHLPPSMQEFLDKGGWWIVLAALAVASLLWLRTMWRRLRRALFHKRRALRKQAKDKKSALVIDLDLVGDAFTDPGPQQITVRGEPGRLRVVVLAPSPNYVGELMPEMAESLLDWLLPGLGETIEFDKPRLLAWPRHPSLGRFVERFRELVQIPEVKGRRSPWILIPGSARMGRQTVFVGLVIFLDKTSYLRELQIEREKWNEVLGLQKVTEPI